MVLENNGHYGNATNSNSKRNITDKSTGKKLPQLRGQGKLRCWQQNGFIMIWFIVLFQILSMTTIHTRFISDENDSGNGDTITASKSTSNTKSQSRSLNTIGEMPSSSTDRVGGPVSTSNAPHQKHSFKVNNTMLEIPEKYWQNETSPMQDLLRVYVYDNIHPNFTIGIETQMTKKIVENPLSEVDFRIELVLFKLFRTYPGRTYDPKHADIFVIPYPHFYHCLETLGYQYQCGRSSYFKYLDTIQDALIYSNHKGRNRQHQWIKRHLWVGGVDDGLIHPRIVRAPLHLSLGPKSKFTGEKPYVHDGDLIMPYVNDRPEFQPSVIRGRSDGWWIRDRTYSLVYFYGPSNTKMRNGNGGRRFRQYFYNEIMAMKQKNVSSTEMLGGKPYLLRQIDKEHDTLDTFYDAYHDSVLCLCLPGDGTAQKRFFDVIMSGCLPVVIEWSISNGTDISWFMPDNIPLRNNAWKFALTEFALTAPTSGAYPYWNNIDYRSFVVRVPGNIHNISDMSHILPYLESEVLSNATLIREKQIALQKNAPLFAWGMGDDAHAYEDAFTELLKVLKQYADSL